MACVETSTDFLVDWPEAMSSAEFKKTVSSTEVKWQVCMSVKANVTDTSKFTISVEATAFSTESPAKTKFVYASIQVHAERCRYYCRNTRSCSESDHSYSVLNESPVCNNFHFKLDGLQVSAIPSTYEPSGRSQNIVLATPTYEPYGLSPNILMAAPTYEPYGRSPRVRKLKVKVTLKHYKIAAQEHPHLSSLDPCIMKNLKAMLGSGVMSDVTFVVGGEEIKAHSQILAAASDVFTAMFQHDTEDKRTGRVTVKDVHPSIFKEMLRCVYTDSEPAWIADDPRSKTTYAHDFLIGLLLLAEKYMLVQLRGHCQRRLISTLTVENVVARLRAVNIASPSLVPMLADPFVRMHLAEILPTASWQALMKEDSALAASVLYNAVNSATTASSEVATPFVESPRPSAEEACDEVYYIDGDFNVYG